MRSKCKDLIGRVWNALETGLFVFYQPQTGQMDRSDRSLIGIGEGLGFDDQFATTNARKDDKQCEEQMAES